MTKPSGPVLAGVKKQCMDCRIIRDEAHFGHTRSSVDGFLPYCRDCVNQAKRIRQFKRYGRLRPPPQEINDDILRNNLHHLRFFLREFFSSVNYTVSGPFLHIPTMRSGRFTISRIPNSSKVEVQVTYDVGGFDEFFGLDRLKENAIETLCVVLRDYRLEPNDYMMRMARLYIYDR